VYDVEAGGWRSFVWTRIKSIEYHDPWPDQTRQEFDKNPPF
jgi:predicted DNA-binding transcriptional regulator YafY